MTFPEILFSALAFTAAVFVVKEVREGLRDCREMDKRRAAAIPRRKVPHASRVEDGVCVYGCALMNQRRWGQQCPECGYTTPRRRKEYTES